MSRNTEELQGISLLGNQKTQYPTGYAPEILEAFDDPETEEQAVDAEVVTNDNAAGEVIATAEAEEDEDEA